MSEIRSKKKSFGGCTFRKSSPTISVETSTVNFTISFEEALKLNIAVQECVRQLNSYNRATSLGKSAALALIVHVDKKRIRVQEGKLNDP